MNNKIFRISTILAIATTVCYTANGYAKRPKTTVTICNKSCIEHNFVFESKGLYKNRYIKQNHCHTFTLHVDCAKRSPQYCTAGLSTFIASPRKTRKVIKKSGHTLNFYKNVHGGAGRLNVCITDSKLEDSYN